MKHVVKYTESERGWGGEIWYVGWDTKEEAEERVRISNKDLPTDHVPDYYIMAEYVGEMEEVPKSTRH